MKILNRLYGWYGKRMVLTAATLIVVLIVTGIVVQFILNKSNQNVSAEADLPLVKVQNIAALNGDATFRVTGSISAISEARLQTEAGGRITGVNVELGEAVQAGTIIATIENSAQNAALLQAEGAYEQALANAASSESSTQSAATSLNAALSDAINTYRSGFISTDSSVRNTVDDLFTNLESSVPGFLLDSFGTAVSLIAERQAIEPMLTTWGEDVNSVDSGNVDERLEKALVSVERVSRFAETLAALVARQETSASFTQTQKDTLEAEFVSVRTTLNQTLLSLQGAQTSITSAKEALNRAQIAGINADVSIASAQVKSALGSLRAAQSNYQKTIVRSPISGVVNALYVKTGDYVSPSQDAAVIANNNALEVTAYVTELESKRLQLGDLVVLDENVSGRITQIAPAVNPSTGKVEVKIQAESSELTNGDIVNVIFTTSLDSDKTERGDIVIPITALKVETDRIIVFTVSDGLLVAHPITEGPLLGDSIVVREGLSTSMDIVVDARGLNEGDAVEIAE